MNDLQYVIRAVTPRGLTRLYPVGARILAAAGVVVCSYWSIRLTIADVWSQSEGIAEARTAANLVPGNARYLLRLGEVSRFSGVSPLPAFRAATEADPRDAGTWTALGFASEESGDYGNAERSFLKAAQLDHQFEPRWTLAGFYLRRQNPVEFWRWTRSALSLGRGDLSPLFSSMWEMSEDAEAIRSLLPDRPIVLAEYFDWLVYTGRFDAAADSAKQALAVAGAKEKTPLLLLCDQMLLNEHRPEDAKAIWNGMLRRKLLTGTQREGDGNLLFNSEFLQAPLNAGFDWRTPRIEGVDVSTSDGLHVEFSGKQPENCNILQQFALVKGGRTLRFQCRYHTDGIAAGTGVKWRMFDADSNIELAASGPDLSSETDTDISTEAAIPSQTRRVVLCLTYRRTLGTVRVEGELTLRSVSLRDED